MTESVLSVVDVLLRTERYFRSRGIESPRLEAELLLAEVLGLSRVQLYLAHDRPMGEPELDGLRALVTRRGKREPFAYVVGKKGFHAIDLEVGPAVLVPRPDTETLVEAALAWMADADPIYVADVGTGSGAIALAIAHARAGARVYAVDVSPEAAAVARKNAVALGLESRVAVLVGDLLAPVPEKRPIDWVVSNPPYVRTGDIAGLQPEIQFEPRLALDGGPDGLDVYRRLVPEAARRARAGVLVEVGEGQAPAVADLLRRAGLVDLTTWNDLGGIARVVGGRVRTP